MAFLEYVCVLFRSIVSNSLCPHVFSLLGSCVHEFSRQEYGSGLPFPPPGDLPNSEIKLLSLASPAWAGQPFTSQSVSSVAQLCPTLWRYGLQHARLPCPSPTPGACSNSSIESVMPSNHLILCHPLLLLPSIIPSIRVFSSELALHIKWPSIGVSASTSVFPMNTQDWSPLDWTGWISLQSKGLSSLLQHHS